MFHNSLNSSTVNPVLPCEFPWQAGVKESRSFKNIIIIYLVMMAYKAEFSMIRFNKLKNDSVRNIYPKAPDLMTFWVQLLHSQRRVKGVSFEKLCLFYRLLLDRFGKGFKEFIEGCCSGNLHLFIFKNFGEGFPLCNPAFFVVFLGEV